MTRYRSFFSIIIVCFAVVFVFLSQTAHGAALQRSSFHLPGDGQRNNNRTIGDYCCTGETAIVRTPNGDEIGYIYFHDFSGSYNIGNNKSVAATLGILVSGISDIWNMNSLRAKRSIQFHAIDLTKGATRSVTAGTLRYTATILRARRTKSRKQYYMGSVEVRVDVSLAGSEPQTTTGSSGGSEPENAVRDVDLSKTSFYLPGDGRRNDNQTIGDFCCTGETATVSTTNGDAVGYIYFYGFGGARNIGNNQSIASSFSIHVSGASDLTNPSSRREKRSIDFRAKELRPGMRDSVRVGALKYTATILKAKRTKDRKYFYMGTVKVRVKVKVSH